MDFENDMKIDESALDVEWLDQPRRMLRYAQYAAKMKKKMDLAKESLDVKRAELDKDIRSNPDLFGISKITETVITNTITAHADYQEKSNAFIDAKYEYDMAQAAVRSMDQRKVALENLVKLHGMSYFAGPSVPRDLTKEWEVKQNQKNADNKVSKKMKRKKTDNTDNAENADD